MSIIEAEELSSLYKNAFSDHAIVPFFICASRQSTVLDNFFK